MTITDINPPSVLDDGPGWAEALLQCFAAIKAHLEALQAGTEISNGVIGEAKLDVSNDPATDYLLSFSTKLKWVQQILVAHLPVTGTPTTNDVMGYVPADGETPERFVWLAEIPANKLALIPVSKLDTANPPSDAALFIYDSESGKGKWVTESGIIPMEYLNIQGTPSEGYIVKWNQTAGLPEWNPGAAASDTGAIRISVDSPMDYPVNLMSELLTLMFCI